MNDKELNGEVAEQQETEPVIKIRVSPDNMKAYMSIGIPDNCREITKKDLLDALEEGGITYGINHEEIERRCESKSFFSELLCAQGKQPIDGKDGTMSFHFDTEHVLKPRERADGGADFHDMGIIQSVSKDELLCSRTMPMPGEDGINVSGIVVDFKPGEEKKFPNGANTYISEDQLELRAAIDGNINFKNGIVSIDDTFTVKGDIDTSTGDIIFCGNVVVLGDIREGFKIHAGKDVTIKGMVEGATIWANGSITITEGMNGMNIGKLFAGGNIKGRYFQNTQIMCQGDVAADYFLNSEVTCGGTITAEGIKGLLLGGRYQAGLEVCAKTIGADTYLATSVSIRDCADGFWDPERQKTPEQIEEELAQMDEEEREQWLAEHVYVVPSAPKEARVIAKSIAYPGVKLTIGQVTLNLNEEYSNVKFLLSDEGIEPITAPK